MTYVVVGAGAIGGTVAAGLVRDGHEVLVCDADPEHVAAINRDGLAIEGPVEEYTVRVPAVSPDDLPDAIGDVLLAVKAHHTGAAMRTIAPRLAPDGYVVSLQNGMNEPEIVAAVGADRVVGAFVNFGADVVGPGRILRGNRATFRIGELDGTESERVRRLAADIADAEVTTNVAGYLWAKEAYGAMLFATAVSDLSIADALAEPAYRPLFLALAREVLDQATAPPEPFDGFDPDDLEGSIDRLVEFNRGSAKTHSGIYRDLAVRHRKTEVDAMLGSLEGPLVRRTGELIHAIEEGRRVCERANLDLLAAYERLERLGRPLNAVIDVVDAPDRAAAGPFHGVPVAVKDNMDMEGLVTTNASTVAVSPPAEADAEVAARLRASGADLFCKTNLLEYAAGSVNPTYGMTFNPLNPERTSGGSSSGSAALVAAGVCDHALGSDTGGSIRIPAAYCGIVGLKPTYGLVPVAGVFELSPTLDHVGPLARTVRGAAELLAVVSGAPCPVEPVGGVRVGVLARHLAEPQLRPGVRDRVREAIEQLAALGFAVREVDVAELDTADAALGTIVLYEAWQAHRTRYEAEAELYGPGTRHLLELGREISEDDYRAARADGERIAAGFDRALAEVDVLAGPTVAYVAPPEDPPFGTPDGDVEARFTGPYNLAGMPAVSVPCGPAEDGLPAGLQLAAARGRDAFLLSVAAAHEEAFHAGA
ncbi:MAG TPA: amidase family protein [Gaiellales bacterium]|nr:amidase family protein [Gaiellales bacterium]